MKKKIFAVSDLHGHYFETIAALASAGWSAEDSSHLLVVCGDLFDRGQNSLEVFRFLDEMVKNDKAIVLQGNHEEFFTQWLEGPTSHFNYMFNGLRETVDSFLGEQKSFSKWFQKNPDSKDPWYEFSDDARKKINHKYPELLGWLKNLPHYFETEHYIFTHGSIQTFGNWKEPAGGWKHHHWDKGEFFSQDISSTDKIVVVGHFGTASIREMYEMRSYEDHSILVRDDGKVIMIDGCTALTKEVNVLSVSDELCT